MWHKNMHLFASEGALNDAEMMVNLRGINSLPLHQPFPVFPTLPRNLASRSFKLQLLENSTFHKACDRNSYYFYIDPCQE